MPVRRRMHLKLKTDDYLRFEDMRRYSGYKDTPVTEEPIAQKWAGSKCTVHRFEEGEFTFLRQPSILNRNWGLMVGERYRSFGVRTELVMR